MSAKHHELVHLVIAISVAISVAEAAISIAKPGCQQKCGNVDIPYPFGIGNSSCFLDEWFEIACVRPNTSSGGSKPFLKKLNLELLQVRFPTYNLETNGYIYVQNPVIVSSSNCTGRTSSTGVTTAVDLTGSTFYFSRKYNRFGAAGCNSQAWMTDGSGRQLGSFGCNPSCSSTGVGKCCKVEMPASLQLFNVSITSSTSDDDGSCRYAFIAREEWFGEHPSTSCFTDITDLNSVPAWIDFGLKDIDPLAVSLQQAKTESSAFGCTEYRYSDRTKIVFCFCKKGYEGNPYLQNGCEDKNECLEPPKGCNGCRNTIGSYTCRSTTDIVVKVVCSIIGVVLLILVIWGGFKIMKNLWRKKYFKQNGGELVTKNEGNAKRTTLYKLEEMVKATCNFSKKNRLGAGGQGTVFKGSLSDGTQVAVKVCKKVETKDKKPERSSKGVPDESLEAPDHDKHEMAAFITEILLLSETIHKNIVKLWGCCLEAKNPLLVYEHLVNGDLSTHLQNQNVHDGLFILSWDMRLKIATEIAGALSYLHFSARYPIFHRDIKTENILLDHNYTAKIADFGISKSVTRYHSRVDMPVQGSRGYIDPEYIESGQYTAKSDVYSFGVVLVEILTGRKPVFSYTTPGGEQVTVILANHFKAMKVEQIMSTFLDVRVKHQGQPKEIVDVANLAKLCLNSEGNLRPTMKEVAMELERISALHNNVYNADEIDQHDYESVENPAMSPIREQLREPLRGQNSDLSDA